MARGELCDIINGAAPPKDGSNAADPLTVGVIGGGGDAATNKVRRRWCTLPNAKRAATLQPRGAAGAPGTHKRPQRVTGLYTQIGSAPMVLAVRGCEARRLLARSRPAAELWLCRSALLAAHARAATAPTTPLMGGGTRQPQVGVHVWHFLTLCLAVAARCACSLTAVVFPRGRTSKFDAIVGALEDIICDETFVDAQRAFCLAHCDVFEDTEENKLEYTPLFEQYVETMEAIIDERLKAAVEAFDMTEFLGMLEAEQAKAEAEGKGPSRGCQNCHAGLDGASAAVGGRLLGGDRWRRLTRWPLPCITMPPASSDQPYLSSGAEGEDGSSSLEGDVFEMLFELGDFEAFKVCMQGSTCVALLVVHSAAR